MGADEHPPLRQVKVSDDEDESIIKRGLEEVRGARMDGIGAWATHMLRLLMAKSPLANH